MSRSGSSLGRIREAYGRADGTLYGSAAKFLVGFALLASLPELLGVSVFGYRLGMFLSVNILIVTVVYATAGQAWNIMSGYTGYFSFGHAAFFGIGAYVTSKLSVAFGVSPWAGLLVGGVVAGFVGLVVGYLNFRYDLQGHYFALATFAIALLLQVVVRNMGELGGAVGIYRPFPGDYGADFGLVAMQFRQPSSYYYVIVAFLLVVTVAAWLIKRSQIGLYLFAIRENEDAAASLGISPFRYKMFAIGTSAFFTAWCGAFWSMYVEIIRPSTVFGLTRNVQILLPAVIGGIGSVPGAILGAFVVFPLSEALRLSFPDTPGLNTVVYGVALVLIALLLPNGVISLGRRLRGRRADDDSGPGDVSSEERPSVDD